MIFAQCIQARQNYENYPLYTPREFEEFLNRASQNHLLIDRCALNARQGRIGFDSPEYQHAIENEFRLARNRLETSFYYSDLPQQGRLFSQLDAMGLLDERVRQGKDCPNHNHRFRFLTSGLVSLEHLLNPTLVKSPAQERALAALIGGVAAAIGSVLGQIALNADGRHYAVLGVLSGGAVALAFRGIYEVIENITLYRRGQRSVGGALSNIVRDVSLTTLAGTLGSMLGSMVGETDLPPALRFSLGVVLGGSIGAGMGDYLAERFYPRHP